MAKNIIVCCDGTGQQFQRNTTNPLRLYTVSTTAPAKSPSTTPGVGTAGSKGPQYTAGELKNLAATAWRTIQGQGRGVGIIRNIQDAYRYLMQVYYPGDRVYLFGFSRGAFTAQAVAGMLAKCGLRWMIDQAQHHGVQFNDQRVNEFQPDYAGQLHTSCTGLWRLRGTKRRDIPKNATIHPSAIKRYQQGIDGYAPPNWPRKTM